MSLRQLVLACAIGATGMTAAFGASPVTLGIRAAANVSTIGGSRLLPFGAPGLERNSWRAGGSVGVVADIQFSRSFAVQPGVIADFRSSGYELIAPASGSALMTRVKGKIGTDYLQIPVLASYRLSAGSNVQIQVDAGPYFSIGLAGHDRYTSETYTGEVPDRGPQEMRLDSFGSSDRARFHRFDWGFKMGVGARLFGHYYIGVHYLAGCRDIAKCEAELDKSRTKGWEFSIGYDF